MSSDARSASNGSGPARDLALSCAELTLQRRGSDATFTATNTTEALLTVHVSAPSSDAFEWEVEGALSHPVSDPESICAIVAPNQEFVVRVRCGPPGSAALDEHPSETLRDVIALVTPNQAHRVRLVAPGSGEGAEAAYPSEEWINAGLEDLERRVRQLLHEPDPSEAPAASTRPEPLPPAPAGRPARPTEDAAADHAEVAALRSPRAARAPPAGEPANEDECAPGPVQLQLSPRRKGAAAAAKDAQPAEDDKPHVVGGLPAFTTGGGSASNPPPDFWDVTPVEMPVIRASIQVKGRVATVVRSDSDAASSGAPVAGPARTTSRGGPGSVGSSKQSSPAKAGAAVSLKSGGVFEIDGVMYDAKGRPLADANAPRPVSKAPAKRTAGRAAGVREGNERETGRWGVIWGTDQDSGGSDCAGTSEQGRGRAAGEPAARASAKAGTARGQQVRTTTVASTRDLNRNWDAIEGV
ncbi:unnamed protein product [Pedinophyceae sp. YPF-701]|nr:unnamed protein product [Pedinophyceae sp. YPF-701]